MIGFIEKNENPKNKYTTDCVIRALCGATGKEYWSVFDELVQLTKKTGIMFNEKRVEDKFLEQNGFVKIKQPRKWDGTKYMVKEIDQICDKNVILIRVAHHLTVVKDGYCVDTWDCRRKTIGNYYIKKEN